MRPTRVSALFVVVSLLAAACSSVDAAQAPTSLVGSSSTTRPSVPSTSDSVDVTTAPPSSTVDSTAAPTDSTSNGGADGAGQNAGGGSPAASVPSRGGSPAVTSPPPASTDPMSVYRGVLGKLGLDDLLAPPTAAAPIALANTAPLTGQWLAEVPQRNAVVVKIDNAAKARPQSGLNNADIVIEEEVEGNVTRLAAIFHSQSVVAGPVRSGRTTDLSFLTGLGNPSLVYSGANKVTDQLLLRLTSVFNFNAARSSGYWRNSSRRAPHNLFTDTASFFQPGSPPPAQFHYRPAGTDAPWPIASSIRIDFGGAVAGWTWNPAIDGWSRSQDGAAHNTDGGRISTTNVVIAVVSEVDSGFVDSSGGRSPEFVFAGTGPVIVFAGDRVTEGIWTRPTLRSPAILTDASGAVIELDPGRTWIELVTPGAATWS